MATRTLNRILALVALAVLLPVVPTHAADTNGDGAETILFPFALIDDNQQVPGANGTIWSGEVWYENRYFAPLGPVWDTCNVPISTPCPDTVLRYGLPTRLLRPAPLRISPHAPFRLVIPVDAARDITFSSRIFERTLRAQPRGVEIPVVREREFFTGPQIFLGVPADAGVRVSLRVYDPGVGLRNPPTPALEKIIAEVRSNRGAEPLGEFELRPAVLDATGLVHDFHKPGFAAVYDLAAIMPSVLAYDRIHISVRPVPDGAQYWGMVAVTDNETQTLSIITAQ